MARHILGMLGLAAGIASLTSPASASFTVNLRPGGYIQFCWVGDLNGDGNPDYVIDRQENPQRLEAYRHDGAFMWEVNFGPNSANQDNISPGSATVDVGHNDGVTVYDLNGDGRSEVIIKIANGVRFGNGEVWTHSDNNRQWIAVLEGSTGRRLNYAALPTDYLSVGPLATRFVCGNAGIFVYAKNRNANGSFNLVVSNYRWSGSNLTQAWKWLRGSQNCPDGHNSRSVDVNGDGTDDFCEIGFVLNGTNGTLLYTLGTQGVVHGDRFHIAKIDPDRAGLQGYGIQQDNPSGLIDYYYDARNGTMLWKHMGAVGDWARGDAGDIDGAVRGYEVWTFNGVWNARSNRQLCPPGTEPWPSLRIWWDTDDLAESYNDGKFEKYVPSSTSTGRRVTRLYNITDYAADAARNTRGAPIFYGDFIGDWREEVIVRNATNDKLYVLTPPGTSNTRPTLRNDRYYRNCLSAKGYMQSHHVSFYIGQ
jgi:rhamnogalacturonan endolyase